MKQNRLFGIIYLLLCKDTMTAKQLADYFEVSIRTIYRDIDVLCELGIPIYLSKGKNGGIKLLENYKLDKALLTDLEQKQILFSLQGLSKLNINDKDLYQKMKNLFAKDDDDWFEIDFSSWSSDDRAKEMFNLIKEATIKSQVIEFMYYNSYGESSKRKVEPFKLCFKHNAWYLWGFDKDKNDDRFFKIMRMKNVKLLNDFFERDFKKLKNIPKKKPQMVDLVLEIDASQAYRVYDEFFKEKIEKQDNGNFIVKVSFPLTEWVYGYLMSFGENIKILEPEDIKLEIIARLKQSLANYL